MFGSSRNYVPSGLRLVGSGLGQFLAPAMHGDCPTSPYKLKRRSRTG